MKKKKNRLHFTLKENWTDLDFLRFSFFSQKSDFYGRTLDTCTYPVCLTRR